MATRTGLPTIRKIAQVLCRLIGTWGAVVKASTPGNTSLHTAIDAASAACAVLVVEADLALPVGD